MNWKALVLATLALSPKLRAETPALPPAAPIQAGSPGTILVDYFRGIDGGAIDDLTKNPAFPAHPTESMLVKSFAVGPNDEDNYGSVTRGFIVAPATGSYTFWISADDAGELYLSTDESPERRRKVCACTNWVGPGVYDQLPEQKSEPIALTAGTKYYVEAWHKEAGPPGHLAVGWQLPDGKKEMPIPGSRLIPAGVAKVAPPLKVSVALNPATLAATTPGQHKFPGDATVDRNGYQWKMSYLIHLPNGYDKGKDKKPLFVFLCGNSHQGADLGGILNEGPAQYLNDIPKLKAYWPFIGLFPQPPDNMRWDSPGMAEAVVGLVDEIVKKYRVDPDQVYLSGLSMGGKGTWLVAEAAPDRFAAIAPICAVSVKPDQAGDILKHLPAWIICGSDDGGFTEGSKQMAQVLKAAGGKAQLTVVPNEGHGVWGRFYPETKFYDWLLKHRRTPEQAAKSAAATRPAK